MPKYSTAFGMDVHLRSTTVCALDADTGEAVTRRFPGNPWGEIAGWMASRRVRGRVATPCGSEASAVRATRS